MTEAIYRVHGFRGWQQRYDRVAEVLDEPGLRRGRVLAADAYLIEAAAMWEAALAALRRDPFFFVERKELANALDAELSTNSTTNSLLQHSPTLADEGGR